MLPVGWYSLIDKDGEVIRMLIFENQLQGIGNMMRDKASWTKDSSFHATEALKKYFNGFEEELNMDELELLIDNVQNNEESPSIHIFENRKKIEPLYVAAAAEKEGMELMEYAGTVYDTYPIAADLYDSKEAYILKVCEAKLYGKKKRMIGQSVEELPVELIPFDRTPVYDLEKLAEEVKQEMFNGSFENLGTIKWTDRAYKGYYGKYFSATHNIVINSVLNSKEVPKEVVKFVLYHEMLHRDNLTHDSAFREQEHQYPNYEEWEYFLDAHMEQFDIKEW